MQGIKNLTHGPINRQLFNLAMPIMATSLICWNMRNASRFILNFLSDQTSCHAVYEGGYCPVGLTFESAPAFFMNLLISSVVWQTLLCAAILR